MSSLADPYPVRVQVGVFCNVKGKFSVVEYSDISPDVAKATTASGDLVYSAGHVCINYFTVGFFKVRFCWHSLPVFARLGPIPCWPSPWLSRNP